jgi:hypothetical protein
MTIAVHKGNIPEGTMAISRKRSKKYVAVKKRVKPKKGKSYMTTVYKLKAKYKKKGKK